MKETSNYSFPFLKVVLASVLSFFLFSGNVSAQPSVKGRVTDQNGQPLPGVSVIVAGTTNGTMTGSDGSYVISVAKGQTLEFQCLGMTSFRKLCDGTVQVLNVTLKEDTAYLDEVVVVGYGTSKKSSLTGAVSAIKGGRGPEGSGLERLSDSCRASSGHLLCARVRRTWSGSGFPASARLDLRNRLRCGRISGE